MVRIANIWDKPTIVSLFGMFHEESGYVSNTDTSRFEDTLDHMLDDDSCLVIVLEKEGSVVGFLLGVLAPSPFCDDIAASELAWFVHPEHRSGLGGFKLLRLFEDWATFNKADHVVMACIDGVNDIGGFYERRGYTRRETTYSRRL